MTSFVKDKIFIEFSTLLKKEECFLSGSAINFNFNFDFKLIFASKQ